MKQYIIDLYWKEVIVTQNDDWTFNKPKEILDYVWIWTATKPAHEPICMARKPLDRWWKIKDDGKKIMGRVMTVAENVLKWGTGGINIDESRVGTDGARFNGRNVDSDIYGKYGTDKPKEVYDDGRFPANTIHDNSEEVRECFPESGKWNGKGAYNYAGREYDNKDTSMFNGDKPQSSSNFNDSWNASRFFKSIIYQSKASKKDRWQWNNHPTVKPVALMEYLIKMTTREWQIVLDPFSWSWTTAVACKNTWRNFIWIEMSQEYVDIAKKRIDEV